MPATPPVHHPAPLNQFYRLDYDEVRKAWVKTVRWNHRHNNANGVMTNWDAFLCMADQGAEMLDAHTAGAKRASPGQVHDHQDDQLGGIGVDDVKTALARGWNETISTPLNFSWDDCMDALAERHYIILAVDYSKVPDEFAKQPAHDFAHAIGLSAIRDDGSNFRYDSLDTRAVWVPQRAFRTAAEAMAIQNGRSRNSLFVALSRARPIVTSGDVFKVVVHPEKGTKGYPSFRYFGLYTVSGNTITKAEVLRTGGFSGTADQFGADRNGTFAWPGHSRQPLVRITSNEHVAGRNLKGYYIRDAYAVEA
jgi:hypothetical protein